MRSHVEIGLAALLWTLCTGMSYADQPGVPLFDGKTLHGWTIKAAPRDAALAARAWRVEGGAIVADSVGHTEHDYLWLATNKEFADFELHLRFQVSRGVTGNSGVQLRSRYDDQSHYLDGPQIDINPPGPWRTGMIWDETRGNRRWLSPNLPSNKWVSPAMAPKDLNFRYADQGDGWNDLRILAVGTKITAWLNNLTVTDYDGAGVLDDTLHRQRQVGTKGVVALQIHGGTEVLIRFKDIRLQEK